MLEIAIVAALLIGIYFFIKSKNDRFYQRGDQALANVDPLEFMEKRYSELFTFDEKAIFHFMVNRPWKDSAHWFGYLIEARTMAEKPETDSESAEYLNGMYKSMVGNLPLEMKVKLVGLPKAIRDSAPREYGAWSNEYKQFLNQSPNAYVGEFVAHSSKAATEAYLQKYNG